MTLDEVIARYPGAHIFTFGDSETLCRRLNDLVRFGRKRATCGALRDFEGEGAEPMPRPGRCDVSLNWAGTPALVIRTISVDVMRFCDVPANFALAEGEDDTLRGWQRSHRDYFTRNGGFDPHTALVCERFELVEDLEVAE